MASNFKKTSILAIGFFFIGFFWFKITVLSILFLLLFLYLNKKSAFNLHKNFAIALTSLLFFYTFYILFDLINSPNSDLLDLIKHAIVLIVIFSLAYIAASNRKEVEIILYATAIGILARSFFVLIYTLLNHPNLLLSREMLDPFYITATIVNTPGYADGAIFSSVIALYYIFHKETPLWQKIFSFIIVGIGAFIAFTLQTRGYFGAVGIVLLLLLITNLSTLLKNIPLLLGASIVTFFLITTLYSTNTTVQKSFDKMLERVDKKKADSPRYQLWVNGLENIITHPLGGGKVDQKIDNVPFFHNFWLDTVRTSGVIPLVIILFFQLYFLKTLKDTFFLLSLFGVLFVFMIEIPMGNKQLFAFFLILYALGIKNFFLVKQLTAKAKIVNDTNPNLKS